MIWIDLIYNLSLLIALSVVSGFVDMRWARSTRLGVLLQGVVFGSAAAIGMLRPFVLGPGLIFDGRSVMISLGGLFFGPWTAAVACLATIPLRVAQGGPGAVMGVAVILVSAALGVALHLRRRGKPVEIASATLLIFGFTVHLAMLAMTVTLPTEMIFPVLKRIAWPVLLVFPLATVLIGKILSDQAARARFLETLRQSAERHKAILQAAMDGCWLSDMQGRLLEVNAAYCRMSGYSAQELLTMRIADLDASYAAEEIASHIQNIAVKTEIRFQTRHRRKDGSHFDVEISAQYQAEEGGLIVAFLQDITERKRVEEALRESEEKFRVLADSTPTAVMVFQGDHWVYANRAAENMCGYSETELQTMAFWEFVHPDFQPLIREIGQKRQLGEDTAKHFEFKIIAKDGTEKWVDLFGDSTTLQGKISVIISVLDITGRKRTESELQNMRKLQSVGTLAGGIAHDFNNILTGLFGNISLAKEELAKEHPGYTYLGEAEKSMNRAVRLTKQLLTFAKGGDPVKEDVSLGALVEEVVRFDLSGSNVSLIYRQVENLWTAEADKGQIQQVISNLTVNARQAMPEGGHLYITLENADLTATAIAGLVRGKYVKVSVRDEGTGIDRKHLERIFDPYFTTKQTGNGLGLATAYSIINKHGGHIGVDSELGKGTTFTFYLPACGLPQRAEEKPPAADSLPAARTAKILVMDDDATISKLVEQMLGPCGYSVATAPGGSEALALYKQALDAGAPFDVVIMDLTIPGGIGGQEAIKSFLAVDPHVRAIVSSGYAVDPVMANFAEHGFKGVASKPYTKSELSETVAQVLKGDPTTWSREPAH